MALTDRDLIVVKNETDKHRPFRSSFAVTSRVHYYEVIPVTDGEMRFGWATRQAELSWWKQIGDDEHSIGFEFRNESYIYHKHDVGRNYVKGKYKIQIKSPHASPTVIGCLIDTCNRQFHFYINGQQVESPDNVHFSTWPYYATVSLWGKQECQLNFGQALFKFPPKNVRISDFNKESGNIEKYQLTKTNEYMEYFWFAHAVITNQVPLFYCDPEQVECDELVRQPELIEYNQITPLDRSVKCGRLIQSVIEVMDRKLTWNRDDLLGKWLRDVIKGIEWEKANLIELLWPYHQLSIDYINSTKSHNISTILLLVLFNSISNFSSYIVENFHNLDIFLLHSIEAFQLFIYPKLFITDPLKMLNVINRLESFPLPQTKQTLLNNPFLKCFLNWCSELFDHVSSVSQLYKPSCDLKRCMLYAGICARWFRDQVMQAEEKYFPSQSTLNPADMSEHIKLSSDCLSARNDYDDWQSVRSVCSVSSGIFYYEAVLLTYGGIRIGWATKQSDLNENQIGWDEYSIGFDGFFGYTIVHQWKNFYDNSLNFDLNSFNLLTFKPEWSVGDIVGCLIDCDKKIFKFYWNGKLANCKEKIIDKDGEEFILHFSEKPYHAAVSLNQHSQCYLNLGQWPFRHPPSVPFRTFHDLSHNSPPRPLHSPRLSECYSVVQVLVKDRIKLFFADDKQKKSDQLAIKIVENVSNDKNLQINSKSDVHCLRLIQSLISISMPNLSESCFSVHANIIAHLITQSTSSNPAFPDLVAQMLYPYFTLHLTNDTVSTHRNVCIVLVTFLNEINNFESRTNLYELVFKYLTQIVSNCDLFTDQWLFKFATLAIENMDLNEQKIKQLKLNAEFCKTIESRRILNFNKISSFTRSPSLSLVCQLEFFSKWTFNLLNSNQTNSHSSEANHETLDSSNCSTHLRLSPDLLSARSDRNWQSVRSLNSISLTRYYYEVTLATSGPMRFGWAAENVDLTKNKLGDDEYSIVFDGYTRCVWHRGKQYSKELHAIPQWNVGDIVGCMILKEEKRFVFYINEKPIPILFLENFTTDQLYYPAVSLSSFQQCQFNFAPIKYPSTRTLVNNEIELMFDDMEQTTLNESVKQIETAIDMKYPIVNEIKENEPLRMIQSFIEVTGEQFVYDRMSVVMEWVCQMISHSVAFSSFHDNLLHLLYPYFTLHLTGDTARKHRNVCIVLSSLIKSQLQLPSNLRVLTLTYFAEIVIISNEFSDDLLLVIVLIALGNMKLTENERNKLKSNEKFCNELKKLSNPDLNDIAILAKLSIVRQLVFLSQFTLENLLNLYQINLHSSLTHRETLDPSKCSCNIKLSPDLLTARNDFNWQSVRSLCSISSKRYYYEVTLVTSGPMRFGWAAENVDLAKSILGDDEYSIALDGHNRSIWHQGKQHSKTLIIPQWKVGDIVGCMILTDEKRFAFFLNGNTIAMSFLANFITDQLYYPAASLSSFQQCQFNFALVKYPSTRTLVNNEIELMFDDMEQTTLNESVKQIETAIDMKYPIVNAIQENEPLRLIQSFIEVTGEQFEYDRMSVVMEWVCQMISHSFAFSSFHDNLLHLLYPYFTLHLTSDTARKHRNVCIVLSSLIKSQLQLPSNLRVLTLTYFSEIVIISNEFSDDLLLVIVLIVLGNMKLTEEETNKLKSSEKFCNALKRLSNPDLNDIAILAKLSIVRQLVLLSQWTFENLLNLCQTNLHSSQTNRETLDPSKCSSNIKLSSDLLSSRSDCNWQSVRSLTSISSKRYYYEVTLVTSGPMRFGWAAENVDLTKNKLGDDEYSIGFDGHNRCVWHRGRQYAIRNTFQEWTEGDVVGCMILMTEKKFAFYLNKELVQMPFFSSSPYFSTVKSYFAAASLLTFQQCQFNFSVVQYPSRKPSFRLIDTLRNSLDKGCRHVILTGATVVNSWINVGSRIEAGNVSSTYIAGDQSKENYQYIPDINSKSQSNTKSQEQSNDQQMFDEREEELTKNDKKRD